MTKQEFMAAAVRHGVVPASAVEDAEGHDSYHTYECLSALWEEACRRMSADDCPVCDGIDPTCGQPCKPYRQALETVVADPGVPARVKSVAQLALAGPNDLCDCGYFCHKSRGSLVEPLGAQCRKETP